MRGAPVARSLPRLTCQMLGGARRLADALDPRRRRPRYGLASYSQEGEDMILRRYFEGKREPGFYVDVGAHHPLRFSNTQFFYGRGWRGVNIDATPGSMAEFARVRPRDVNVEQAVGMPGQRLVLHVFNDPALNTLDAELAKRLLAEHPEYRIVETVELETKALGRILSDSCGDPAVIDFLSVDVEGRDQDVLASNDWERFRPRVVLVECLDAFSLRDVDNSSTARLLRELAYEPWAKTYGTVLFEDSEAR